MSAGVEGSPRQPVVVTGTDARCCTGIRAMYWRNRYLLILLVPGLLFYAIFRYKPMYGILIAFKD